MELDSSQQAAQTQFDSRSIHYGPSHGLANVDDVAQSLDGVSLLPGMKVLDVATGGGHTGLFFARKGLVVTFSDISAEMLERVREALQKENLTGELRHHAAEDLPYPDATFDFVTSRVAPHHFSNPEQFVQSALRVLKPGGYFLLIDVVSPENDREAADWINRVEKLRDPSHVRNHSRKEWVNWALTAGFHMEFAEHYPMKQSDLIRYFEVAGTPPENREEVLRIIGTAPAKMKKIFRLGNEEGKIVWWWQRMRLLAKKPD